MEMVIGKGGFVHDHEVTAFRKEGLGLGQGPIIGHWESGLETRGDWLSSALNG